MSGIRATRPGDDRAKARAGPASVRRYWPGRAPDWAGEEEEGEGLVAAGAAALGGSGSAQPAAPPRPSAWRPPVQPPTVVAAAPARPAVEDARLARLADVQVREGRG